jgi:hypothetical protein
MKQNQRLIQVVGIILTVILAMKSEAHFFKAGHTIDKTIIIAYAKWKQKHQKFFTTPIEDQYRLKIFKDTYEMVTETNKQQSSYELGLNKFSCMTLKEFAAATGGSLNGAEPEHPEEEVSYSVASKGQEHPHVHNWASLKRLTDAREHVNCPNSQAFIAARMLETQKAILDDVVPTRRSPQQIIECDPVFGNQRCEEREVGSMIGTLDYLKKTGVSLEKDYPVKTEAPYYSTCERSSGKLKINKYETLQRNNDYLQEAALVYGVTANGIFVCNQLKQYKRGIFSYNCTWDEDYVFHYGLMFGYDKIKGFYNMRLALGSDWGEGGDLRIKKVNGDQSKGLCHILTAPRRITEFK